MSRCVLDENRAANCLMLHDKGGMQGDTSDDGAGYGFGIEEVGKFDSTVVSWLAHDLSSYYIQYGVFLEREEFLLQCIQVYCFVDARCGQRFGCFIAPLPLRVGPDNFGWQSLGR